MIRWLCQGCGGVLKCRDEYGGQRAKCGECGKIQYIPPFDELFDVNVALPHLDLFGTHPAEAQPEVEPAAEDTASSSSIPWETDQAPAEPTPAPFDQPPAEQTPPPAEQPPAEQTPAPSEQPPVAESANPHPPVAEPQPQPPETAQEAAHTDMQSSGGEGTCVWCMTPATRHKGISGWDFAFCDKDSCVDDATELINAHIFKLMWLDETGTDELPDTPQMKCILDSIARSNGKQG